MKFVLIIVMQVLGGPPNPFVTTVETDSADECQHMGDVYQRSADGARTKLSWLCVEKAKQ